MALARMKLLDKNEEDIIHEQSLRCLREVGMLVRSPLVRKLLKDAGAEVDEKTEVVSFPESLVMDCIKKAPKNFTLYARDKKHDMQLPVDGIPYVGTTGLSIHMTDLDSGETRTAKVKDVADFAKLGDALDQVNFLWSVIIPRDCAGAGPYCIRGLALIDQFRKAPPADRVQEHGGCADADEAGGAALRWRGRA